MAWVKIEQEKHLLPRLNDIERRAYDDSGDSVPYYDKVPAIIEQVVFRVRGAIQSCENNTQFGDSGTIPEECIYHAVSLIKMALVASNPNTNRLQGDERTAEYVAAEAYLERVARCEEAISIPGGETGDTSGAGIEWGSKPQLNFSL